MEYPSAQMVRAASLQATATIRIVKAYCEPDSVCVFSDITRVPGVSADEDVAVLCILWDDYGK